MKKLIIIAVVAAGVSGLLFTFAYAQNNGTFFDDKMMISQNTCPYGNNGQGRQGMKNRNKNRNNNSYKNMNSDSKFKNQNMYKNGKGYGPKDGTGNKGARPLDGTGYGAKNNQ
jgi:hypothetical protein